MNESLASVITMLRDSMILDRVTKISIGQDHVRLSLEPAAPRAPKPPDPSEAKKRAEEEYDNIMYASSGPGV